MLLLMVGVGAADTKIEQSGRLLSHAVYGNETFDGCLPRCRWSCEEPECPAQCEPHCMKPKCEHKCQAVRGGNCTVRCEKPDCEVRCFKSTCTSGPCPKCENVCLKPKCQTVCTSQPPVCKPSCQQPECTWMCEKPKECSKPKCQLKCGKSIGIGSEGDEDGGSY